MSHPVITVDPDMSMPDALALFKRERIRRAPVVKDGKLLGIISKTDLLNASPSQATTLSQWEMTYWLSKIKVKEIMTKEVITVDVNTPIEEAARIMADNKIGGLPVTRDGHVVGMITETDLFKIFLELMGAREMGVRVTALVPDKPGELAKITKAIADAGGSFIAFGQFAGDSVDTRLVTFKVTGLSQEAVKQAIEPVVESIVDIRECCI
jgi:acetoin utilization protein AcuB